MQDFYYELKVTPSLALDNYIDFINSIFSGAIEEHDGTIIVRDEEPLDDIVWAIKTYTQKLENSLNTQVHVDMAQDKKRNLDWIKTYQQSVTGVQVGNFYVHPSWEEQMRDAINIIIDPALSFGSGHHATTAGCLEAIDAFVDATSSVLDVGCGSGVLAIAAAKKGAVVDACDTDQEAVMHTAQNALNNSVELRSVFKGSANSAASKYDVVVANIVADVLSILAKDIINITNQEGIIILSGILDKYEPRVMARYEALSLMKRIQKDEWVTLIMKKGQL